MKKSTKAALISALVFPGAGHLYLNRYLPGIALIAPSCASLYYMVSKSVEEALQIVEKIQSGQVQLDEAALAELLASQPADPHAYLLNLSPGVFIICWLIGIFHSYRVGVTLDNEENNVAKKTKP